MRDRAVFLWGPYVCMWDTPEEERPSLQMHFEDDEATDPYGHHVLGPEGPALTDDERARLTYLVVSRLGPSRWVRTQARIALIWLRFKKYL